MASERNHKGFISVQRCAGNHAFVFPHTACPTCGEALRRVLVAPAARLVAFTTVRVGPADGPFRLGIAELDTGPKTLCLLDDDLVGKDGEEVVLRFENGLYHAGRAAPARGE
jgi:uncharacterized OB-fold protein